MSDPVHTMQMKQYHRKIRNKLDSMYKEKDENGRNRYLSDPAYRDEVLDLVAKNAESYGITDNES